MPWRVVEQNSDSYLQYYCGRAECTDCGNGIPPVEPNNRTQPNRVTPRTHQPRPVEAPRNNNVTINNYSYKPVWLPCGGTVSILIGVELEMEAADRYASRVPQEIANHYGGLFGNRVIFKHDGSLTTGVEMVTHPQSLDKHAEMWDKFTALPSVNNPANEKCGLHVHVELGNVPSIVPRRIVRFLKYGNNHAFVKAIARRDPYNNMYISWNGNEGDVLEQHYGICNTVSGHTVEFRMFRSTSNKEEIMTSIEFAHALFCYATVTTMGTEGDNNRLHITFSNWVRNNSANYPNLIAFINAYYAEPQQQATAVGTVYAPF